LRGKFPIFRRSQYLRSYRLTNSDQIWHGMMVTMWEGRVYKGIRWAPNPKRRDLSAPQFLECPSLCPYTTWRIRPI